MLGTCGTLREIRNANKIWLCKPVYRRIQQENIKVDITGTGYEGTGLDSSNAGNVSLQDFVDTLVLCQGARKERFCGLRSNCRVFKETGGLLAVTG
jgi:hypothetical protein